MSKNNDGTLIYEGNMKKGEYSGKSVYAYNGR